jgi:hypothetical protein
MSTTYTVRTQVATVYGTVILPLVPYDVHTPFGTATLDTTLTLQESEYIYGSPLLYLPPSNPLPNGTYEDQFTAAVYYKLFENGEPNTPQFSINSLNGASSDFYESRYNSGGYLGHYDRNNQFYAYNPNFEYQSRYVIVYGRTRYLTETFYSSDFKKPNYRDLLGGYYLDDRVIPNYPAITSLTDQKAKIAYYRENKFESIGFPSIDWMVYEVDLIANKPTVLPIVDCVLGTLHCDNNSISGLITNLANAPNSYPYSSYFESALPDLFGNWNTLWQAVTVPLTIPSNALTGSAKTEISRALIVLAANNNYWNNQSTSMAVDQNPFSIGVHPLFINNQTRAYNWHIKPQLDGSFGDLIMDSPRTIEIHTALNAGQYLLETAANIGTGTAENPQTPAKHRLDWYIKNSASEKVTAIWKALGGDKYSKNDLDSTKARVTNLGFLIERIAQVLGIRLNANGKIDEELEKTINRRLHVDGSASNDLQKFNPNCFGTEGLLVRYLPNKFNTSGTESGGYRKIKDIPQLLAELHEQANAAMGYQEGTAIEINIDGKTYRYANQLALLTELFITMKQTATYSKGAFFSSVIGEQTVKEIMGGLGLRTVDKFLEFKVAGKTAKLYYKGISASQSIRRKMSAMATNIGTIIGNIT